jgi:hypothetical protein
MRLFLKYFLIAFICSNIPFLVFGAIIALGTTISWAIFMARKNSPSIRTSLGAAVPDLAIGSFIFWLFKGRGLDDLGACLVFFTEFGSIPILLTTILVFIFKDSLYD